MAMTNQFYDSHNYISRRTKLSSRKISRGVSVEWAVSSWKFINQNVFAEALSFHLDLRSVDDVVGDLDSSDRHT